MTEHEAMDLLRSRVAGARSMRAWCRANDVTPTLASSVLTGKTRICPRILAAVGLERVVSYRPVPGAGK